MTKTFKDLKFKAHPVMEGFQAIQFFKNGYGVSVVRFKTYFGDYGSYTSNEKEWEVAILEGSDENDSRITYDTEITDDVIGHLTAREVTRIMRRTAALKKLK